MSAPTTLRLLRHLACTTSRSAFRQPRILPRATRVALTARANVRCLSTTPFRHVGMMPDSEDPQPPKTDSVAAQNSTSPAELDEQSYEEHAERFMNALNEQAEELQEGRDDVEVEYSAGVMSITLPNSGTYVINKQPPNKQIWLSSPISGPKRYDWVVTGEGMHQKADGGIGDWIYLRDGSSLTELLRKEVGISVDLTEEGKALKKPSTDPVE